MSPKVLKLSSWLSLVRGKLVEPDGPICGHSKYDMFVLDEMLGSAVLGAAVISGAGLHPHSPVRLFLKGGPRTERKRVLVHPRNIPAVLPAGCLNDPARLTYQLKLCNSHLDAGARGVMQAIETEVIELSGLDGRAASMSTGRDLGPRFA